MKNKIFILLVAIVVGAYLYYSYLQDSKKDDINNLMNSKLELLRVTKDTILDTYLSVNKKYFYDVLHNKKVIDILREFKYTKDKDRKDLLRGRLYRELFKEYELLKHLNVNQFHFHTYDGKSLLRFHAPEFSADSLISIRKTIRDVINTNKASSGLEGGRAYSGFRYVFPIIDNNDYLGSVEFSITFDAIEKQLNKRLNLLGTELILKKEYSYDKVFKAYRSLFVPSELNSSYFLENSSILKGKLLIEGNELIKHLSCSVSRDKIFIDKFSKHKDFAVPIEYNSKGYIVLFLNIKNTDNKDAGYIVAYKEFKELIFINKHYKNLTILGLIGFFIFFVLILIIFFQIKKMEDEAQRLKKFIDIQDNIVILTDGKQFYFANRSFLEFFNYESFEDFLKEHRCICDFFIESEDFFSLRDVKPDEANWVEFMLNLPPRKRVVSMLDATSTAHAFSVSIAKYDNEKYVISFNDITDSMQEKLELQNQMVKDQLTDAYNRIYFDENIEKLLKLHKIKKLKTGIIFFDIDHFKNVNDTYGHDVGDYVLEALVNIIKKHIRNNDKLIRWGGEEFIIIAPINSIDELKRVAEHLRTSVEEHRFNVVEHITCSFGVDIYKDGENILQTIKRADEKLYIAKERGRNMVIV